MRKRPDGRAPARDVRRGRARTRVVRVWGSRELVARRFGVAAVHAVEEGAATAGGRRSARGEQFRPRDEQDIFDFSGVEPPLARLLGFPSLRLFHRPRPAGRRPRGPPSLAPLRNAQMPVARPSRSLRRHAEGPHHRQLHPPDPSDRGDRRRRRPRTRSPTRQPNPHLRLDLGSVDFLSSVALSQLVGINRKVQAAGGSLVLTNLRPDIHRVFLMARLDRLLDIDPPAKALAS